MNMNSTKEKDFRMHAKAYTGNHTALIFAEELPQNNVYNSSDSDQDDACLPDKQIIGNILNYARSLEVLKPAAGPAMFLLKN